MAKSKKSKWDMSVKELKEVCETAEECCRCEMFDEVDGFCQFCDLGPSEWNFRACKNCGAEI